MGVCIIFLNSMKLMNYPIFRTICMATFRKRRSWHFMRKGSIIQSNCFAWLQLSKDISQHAKRFYHQLETFYTISFRIKNHTRLCKKVKSIVKTILHKQICCMGLKRGEEHGIGKISTLAYLVFHFSLYISLQKIWP